MTTAAAHRSARATARHCDALLGRAARPADLAVEFDRYVRTLTRAVQPLLARTLDCRQLQVIVEDAGRGTGAPHHAAVAQGHAHARFAIGHGGGALLSTAIRDLLTQFDRVLGGSGAVDGIERLTGSADRFAADVEDQFTTALQTAGRSTACSRAARGGDVARVSAIGDTAPVWTARLVAHLPGDVHWPFHLAVCEASLADLVGSKAASAPTGRTLNERGIAGSAIAEIEFQLRAQLVDMPFPLARLARLRAGDVIPVAINRAVPLRVEDALIARAIVGELDDRVAMEITRTFFDEEAV